MARPASRFTELNTWSGPTRTSSSTGGTTTTTIRRLDMPVTMPMRGRIPQPPRCRLADSGASLSRIGVPALARMRAMGIRHVIRGLRQSPAFTLGPIVTLAVSIGLTTAIFSVVYGVLLRQLPYRDADRVFWIWSDRPGRDRSPFNVPDFVDYRASIRSLSGFAGYFPYSANLNDGSATERIQGL